MNNIDEWNDGQPLGLRTVHAYVLVFDMGNLSTFQVSIRAMISICIYNMYYCIHDFPPSLFIAFAYIIPLRLSVNWPIAHLNEKSKQESTEKMASVKYQLNNLHFIDINFRARVFSYMQT